MLSQETTPRQLPFDQDASGRTLGESEIAYVTKAIQSGTLTSTKGEFTQKFETSFAALLGCDHAYACASGSAAVHVAIAAVNPEPGDEIITTSVTDMGALSPIMFQGAIPVFADIDPKTYNVTPESVEACISEKTKAIIVTHLFGNPCDMDGIMSIARKHGILVIEDAAQAFLTEYKGKKIGTIGDIGCFSLQQGKHITTGEGGIVTTNNEDLGRRMYLFINKAWGYGDPKPDHYFLALNYRISELQGAVALAQLEKLPDIVKSRQTLADRATEKLQGMDGVSTPTLTPGGSHVYWKYCLSVDRDNVPEATVQLGGLLRDRGIMCAPRYIQKPAFCCDVIAHQKTFGDSRWPFTLARPEVLDYSKERFPGTYEALARVMVLPWNEKYSNDDVDYVVDAVQDAVRELK